MDAMDALDVSAKRNVELVAQVEPEQWDIPTPCAEWSVRTLVGHLIAGRQVYCELLMGVPATLRPMLKQQSEAVGTDGSRCPPDHCPKVPLPWSGSSI
jgi:Mycothiol maleylpyruvate isomerase N-terminal domain